MLNYQVKRKLKLSILALISYYCFSIPVQAYAGPGVAIGAIIVFLTILLTFFTSLFIKSFKLIKNLFKSLKVKITKKKKIKN